jgi:hypothetical protein
MQIAMGVLDLLPHCVSGVYFIYHSDFSKFSFGKLSALREACLALEGGYQFYYMGYYIHSCPKMKYKNDYSPQYVLDLETFGWDPLDEEVKRLLDRQGYVSISKERQITAGKTEKGDGSDTLPQQDPPTDTSQTYSNRQSYESAALASDAVNDSTSLFDINFPGMMMAEDLEDNVDLDTVKVALGQHGLVRCQVCVTRIIHSSHSKFLNFILVSDFLYRT